MYLMYFFFFPDF